MSCQVAILSRNMQSSSIESSFTPSLFKHQRKGADNEEASLLAMAKSLNKPSLLCSAKMLCFYGIIILELAA